MAHCRPSPTRTAVTDTHRLAATPPLNTDPLNTGHLNTGHLNTDRSGRPLASNSHGAFDVYLDSDSDASGEGPGPVNPNGGPGGGGGGGGYRAARLGGEPEPASAEARLAMHVVARNDAGHGAVLAAVGHLASVR